MNKSSLGKCPAQQTQQHTVSLTQTFGELSTNFFVSCKMLVTYSWHVTARGSLVRLQSHHSVSSVLQHSLHLLVILKTWSDDIPLAICKVPYSMKTHCFRSPHSTQHWQSALDKYFIKSALFVPHLLHATITELKRVTKTQAGSNMCGHGTTVNYVLV